jgi:nitroimidazol reductase NimA-like FMN-containing flavoprotein (pyridoxamine 5'-phosphate oxidase superfamily)
METEHGKLRELSSREIDAVLNEGSHAHLGCRRGNEIYVVPVTYARDGDYLYSHSRRGKKIEMMRSHPHVCIQVEDVKSLFKWRSVVVHAKFEELEELEAARGMRLLMLRILELERARGLTPLEIETSAILSKAVIYRFRIEEATGRSEGYEAED